MLTRLEVDGFKNLIDVRLEFGPFTCIAGPNGVGKSNLFDAITFLSLLAEHRVVRAAQLVRGADEDPTDPRDLFARVDPPPPMTFAAEMVVPHRVRDSFGREADASMTFLRYELELRYVPPSGPERFGRLEIGREELRHINQGEAPAKLRWPHSAGRFRKEVVRGARRGGAFISTEADGGVVVVNTHQDGGSRGKPRPSVARDMTATTIGATSNVDDPTIFAAKTEMLGWSTVALEPRAMRRPDRYWVATDEANVGLDGAHLPATLWRMGATAEARAEVCAQVASRLSALVPVSELRVRANDANQQYELEIREPNQPWLGARALSEGTLRFLALATLSVNPGATRVLCMEEPENGIHPSRISAMLDLLRSIAVDPSEAPGRDNPLVQVIVNTHSSRLVQEIERRDLAGELLIAEVVAVRGPSGSAVSKTVRFRHRRGTWRSTETDPGVGVGVAQAYLDREVGDQVQLVGDGRDY